MIKVKYYGLATQSLIDCPGDASCEEPQIWPCTWPEELLHNCPA